MKRTNSAMKRQADYYKDGFHRYLIHKEKTSILRKRHQRHACTTSFDAVPAKGSVVLHLRLTDQRNERLL